MGFDLSVHHISKAFSGVQALDDISIEFRKGTVHALVGENGAGKSTLINVLGGIYQMDSGELCIDGKPMHFPNPKASQTAGISIVHQEISLIPGLSVAENIYAGRLKQNKFGKILWKEINRDAVEAMHELGIENIAPTQLVKDMTIAQMQMVEIVKAVSFNAQVIIMDEPTSSLTDADIVHLFKIVRMLKEQGRIVIYVSHRMDELFEICDTASIMRDGKLTSTEPVAELTRQSIIEKMVGRKVDIERRENCYATDEIVVEAKHICRGKYLKDVSFALHKGEVLGFSGLVGAGRSELARAVFGVDKMDSGEVFVHGVKQNKLSPRSSLKNGIGLLTENRKEEGVVLEAPVYKNLTLAKLEKITHLGLLSDAKEQESTKSYIKSLRIKCSSHRQKVRNLSGGNQQKVIIGRLLYSENDILFFDEPSRGIDVGAKSEIYHLIDELTKEGKSILLISSELPEILALSDRIMVMREGEIVAELDGRTATQESVLGYMIS